MHTRRVITVLLAMCFFYGAMARSYSANVGKKVRPVEIRDMNNKPMMLPELGKKTLVIFYVDPDTPNQNKKFREYLEINQIHSPNLYCFGVVNLKDAPLLPNAVVRPIAEKKAKETDSEIFSDPDRILAREWDLGDCNNKFMIIIVNTDMVIEFCRWGDYTEADIEEFYRVINKYY